MGGVPVTHVAFWDGPIAPLQGFLPCMGLVPQGAALGYFMLPFQGEKNNCPDVARASRPWTITRKMPMPPSFPVRPPCPRRCRGELRASFCRSSTATLESPCTSGCSLEPGRRYIHGTTELPWKSWAGCLSDGRRAHATTGEEGVILIYLSALSALSAVSHLPPRLRHYPQAQKGIDFWRRCFYLLKWPSSRLPGA